MKQFNKARVWVTMALGVELTQTVWETAVAGAEVYRLAAGEVITNDLYIALPNATPTGSWQSWQPSSLPCI